MTDAAGGLDCRLLDDQEAGARQRQRTEALQMPVTMARLLDGVAVPE